MADDCIFCSILAGDMPGEVVMEDEHTVALMDIAPWTRGHAVVIPRRHVTNLYEIDDEELARVHATARRLAIRVRDALGADGINTLNSTNPAAWQTIFHFHVHVIPRYEGDPLELPTRPQKVSPEDLAEVASKIRG